MSALFVTHPKETDLALFAGGESGPFARWRIERHIETCPECKQTVTEFFHLADELEPLAETPEIDWSAMAASIEARLAAEAPAAVEPQRGVPAWTWQLGAAAACAMVAFAVINIGPKAEEAQAPVAEEGFANKADANKDADVLEEKLQIAQQVSAPAASAGDEQNEEFREAPARQLARMESQAKPLLEKKKEAVAGSRLALADRADERISTDAAAPPPPPPPIMKAMPAEADAEQLAVVAGAPRARRASQAFAPAEASSASALGFADGLAANTQQVAFEVQRLPGAGGEMRVGADGWISVRAINADGGMTITDVYEPQ